MEVNPTRAKFVTDPCAWEWSSARGRFHGADPNELIAPADLGPYTGSAWKQVLDVGWKTAEFAIRLREATRVGRRLVMTYSSPPQKSRRDGTCVSCRVAESPNASQNYRNKLPFRILSPI